MTPRAAHAALVAASAALGWAASSCAPNGFASASVISSVRILASSADEPYAAPGDVVHVSVLAFDGRTASARTTPMGLGFVPTASGGQVVACIDPANDAYYACFARFASIPSTALSGGAAGDAGGASASGGSATDAGASADGASDEAPDGGAPDGGAQVGGAQVGGAQVGGAQVGGALDAGANASADACEAADAAPFNADGSVATPLVVTSSFTMPADVVTAHPAVAGTTPYGLAIVFNTACAGQVGLLPPGASNGNPQAPPVGCFDDAGNALGADDYVFGYFRIYSRLSPDGGYYANANPVVSGLDLPPTTLAVSGSVPSFSAASTLTAICTPSSCPNVKLGVVVPADSWEVNPLDLDANGNPRHEEIWADYLSTFGGFTSTTRLLYDPSLGATSDPDTAFEPPSLGESDLHDGYVFIVVHDDRGGASWVTIPTHVCSDPGDPACAPVSSCDAGG